MFTEILAFSLVLHTNTNGVVLDCDKIAICNQFKMLEASAEVCLKGISCLALRTASDLLQAC